jgi:Roadblock/LC7 domain-containing protein
MVSEEPGMTGDSSVEDRVWAELRLLRTTVAGVYGCLVATNDGLLIAHDVPGLDPPEIAALAATTRSLPCTPPGTARWSRWSGPMT